MSSPPLTPLAAAVLAVEPPERALEVGCGDGDGALFLAREFPSARIRGVDPSPEAIRRATGRVGLDPEGRVAFKVGRTRSLPFPDGYFDLVVALDGLPRPAEVARVLRPGGSLVLAFADADRAPAGLRRRLLGWRLSRAGLEPAGWKAAGDGSFSVARHRRGGGGGGSV